jgi:uncharacterized repeat protein (TIGR03803 family)
VVLAVLGLAKNGFAGARETVLYSFQANSVNGSLDGQQPYGGLVADTAGNLYGTTAFGGAYTWGTVFELSPPTASGDMWTETIIYNFTNGADGGIPESGLTIDSAGNLFGTNISKIFELSPPVTTGDHWTETSIVAFDGPNGGVIGEPLGTLIADAQGNLYGVTQFGGCAQKGCQGVAFELVRPKTDGGSWKEKVIYSFGAGANDGKAPTGNLAIHNGVLYGAAYEGNGTSANGAIFQLTPKPGLWTETILYRFTGGSDGRGPLGVIADEAGNLYGTTIGFSSCTSPSCGTIFQLSRPSIAGGSWKLTTLYRFLNDGDGSDPNPDLWRDRTGNLYGTAVFGGKEIQEVGRGTVFKLKAPSPPDEAWTLVVLHDFAATSQVDGTFPPSGMIFLDNTFYGTTQAGGTEGTGTVFSLVP